MKKFSTAFGTILLVLGCFAFSPAAKADHQSPGYGMSFILVKSVVRHLKPTRNGTLTD